MSSPAVNPSRPITRRVLLSGLAGGLASALLGACGASAPAPTAAPTAAPAPKSAAPTSEPAAAPTTAPATAPTAAPVAAAKPAAPSKPITLKLATDWNAGVRKRTIEYWATQFKTANPGVTVEALHLGAGGMTQADYGGVVQTMLIAGLGPDVMTEIWWRPAEVLLNLDPFLKNVGFKKEDYWWSQYYQETADGKIYALPFGAYLGGMVANVDLFEKAGVPLPSKDWSFDDLRTLAGKLKGDKVWGYERQVGAWNQGWTERVASEGAEWYDREALKTTLDKGKEGGDPVKMFADWWGLVWKDKVAPTPDEAASLAQLSPEGGSAINLFPTGRVALSGFPFNQVGVVKELVGGRFRYQVLWPPKSPYSGRRGYHLETNCISVAKETSARGHADEAFKLAHFWLGDTMSKFIAENQPVMPPALKWHTDPVVLKSAPGMEIFPEVVAEARKIGNDRHKWLGGTGASPNSLEWFRAVRAKLEDRALKAGEDPVASFKAAIEEGDKVLAKKV